MHELVKNLATHRRIEVETRKETFRSTVGKLVELGLGDEMAYTLVHEVHGETDLRVSVDLTKAEIKALKEKIPQ